MVLYLGAHVNRANQFDLNKFVEDIYDKYKFNAIQVYSQSKYATSPPTLNKFNYSSKAKNSITKNDIKFFIHASYRISFTRKILYPTWIKTLLFDFMICDSVGGIGVVIHLGSNTKNYDNIIQLMVNNIHTFILEMEKNDIKSKFIIEIEAKVGSKVIVNLETLNQIWKQLEITLSTKQLDYIRFCLDTCHMYVSRIPMNTPKEVYDIFQYISDNIGIKKITLIHYNDSASKTQDRHENLFEGFIGTKKLGGNPFALLMFAQIAEKYSIPMTIERAKIPIQINYLQTVIIHLLLKQKEENKQIKILDKYYKILKSYDN